MAIKIGGTTVIDDSRNITGISISGLTTPLSVGQGGIGTNTLTANYALLGNGSSAPQAVAPGTVGNVLMSNGTTWQSSTPTGVSAGKSIAFAMVFGL
jgi:hypothetical protein